MPSADKSVGNSRRNREAVDDGNGVEAELVAAAPVGLIGSESGGRGPVPKERQRIHLLCECPNLLMSPD